MNTRTTICIDKSIYGEMKETAKEDFINVSQLIRQMWRDHKIEKLKAPKRLNLKATKPGRKG